MNARQIAILVLVLALLAAAVWGLIDTLQRDTRQSDSSAQSSDGETTDLSPIQEDAGSTGSVEVDPNVQYEPHQENNSARWDHESQPIQPQALPATTEEAELAADVHDMAERLRAYRFDFSSEAQLQRSMVGYTRMVQEVEPLAKRLSESSNPSLQVEGLAVLGESYRRLSQELGKVAPPDRLSPRAQDKYRKRLNELRGDFDSRARKLLEEAVQLGRKETLNTVAFRRAQNILDSLSPVQQP